MPEFNEFLSFVDKLRLGASQRTPRQLARELAEVTRREVDVTNVQEQEHTMAEVVFEVHGPEGVVEFMTEYLKRMKR